MNPMTHERCSELLTSYVHDEIAPDDRAEVRAHLDGCDACRHEEAGLRALLATESGSLDERERTHLRGAVMSAIAASEEEPVPSLFKMQRPAKGAVAQPKRNWRAGLAGAVAAAAVVIVGAVFYLGGGLAGQDTMESGGQDDGDTQQLTQESRSNDEGPAGKEIPAAAPDQAPQGVQGGSAGGDTGSTTATSEGFAEPVPAFIGVERRYTNRRLKHAGQRGLQLVLFSRAYNTRDSSRLRDGFVDRLAQSAARRAGEVAADQVRDCAAVVLAGEDTALPAFGAFGRRGGDDVLVLGFAWRESGSGPLEDYMLWTWRRGSCDSPIDYRSGAIKPEN